MAPPQPIWLVYNRSSGSNDDAALSALESALCDAGFALVGRTCFPDEQPPDAGALDREGTSMLCVFAGDGTVHSVVTSLFGWSGRVIVLPGGTMNLLAKKLHGEASATEIVRRIGAGDARNERPAILRGRLGYALTGVLAGPGTSWNAVREAMRNSQIAGFASAAASAVTETLAGENVVCRSIETMREGGYPAVSIIPGEAGIDVEGYYAETPADYVGQLAALLQRNFRMGPHEAFGPFETVTIESVNGQPMGLLIDGEPHDGQAVESFSSAECQVDLVATREGA